MGRLTVQQKFISLSTHGRFGRPSSFGRIHFGFNLLGIDDSLCGIYKTARFAKGPDISFRPFYFPSNPRTIPQQAHRSKFADAIGAYHALTPLERNAINKKAKANRRTGYNYFISKYLRSH